MDAERFKGMKEVVFQRLTGVKQATFKEMLDILEAAAVEKQASGGRPGKLTVQGQLLMMLEYWREYRTYLRGGPAQLDRISGFLSERSAG